MQGLIDDFAHRVSLMRDSVDLATDVVLEKSCEELLPIVCDKASSRCSAFVLALQSASCSEETTRGGCDVLEKALLDVLSVVQVMHRDLKGQTTLLKKLKGVSAGVFDSVLSLLKVLGADRGMVNAGTGLVWAELKKLAALKLSTSAQVKSLLETAEANVLDTIEEMQELPAVEDDEDDGLTAAELGRAAKALIAVKAARGVLKFAVKCVDESDASKAVAVDGLAASADSISKCVENLGCCLYAPQDAQELKAALLELVAAVESFCALLLLVDDSPPCQKVQSVSSLLCKDSVTKIEETLARDKNKKK